MSIGTAKTARRRREGLSIGSALSQSNLERYRDAAVSAPLARIVDGCFRNSAGTESCAEGLGIGKRPATVQQVVEERNEQSGSRAGATEEDWLEAPHPQRRTIPNIVREIERGGVILRPSIGSVVSTGGNHAGAHTKYMGGARDTSGPPSGSRRPWVSKQRRRRQSRLSAAFHASALQGDRPRVTRRASTKPRSRGTSADLVSRSGNRSRYLSAPRDREVIRASQERPVPQAHLVANTFIARRPRMFSSASASRSSFVTPR
jgi:hypothetical protein